MDQIKMNEEKDDKLSKWILIKHDSEEQLRAYLDKLIAEKNSGVLFDKNVG